MFLNDQLELQLKGTLEEALFTSLFFGEKENVIKCTKIDYESVRTETFAVLQVHLQESNTIEGALKSLFQAEDLTGENQYNHEYYGKQDAQKFVRIKKLPPVL